MSVKEWDASSVYSFEGKEEIAEEVAGEVEDIFGKDFGGEDPSGGTEQLEQQRRRMDRELLAIRRVIFKIQDALATKSHMPPPRRAKEDTGELLDLLKDVRGPGQRYLTDEEKQWLEELWEYYSSM